MNLEAQFRHAQKLECVGQLAAGVAHDLITFSRLSRLCGACAYALQRSIYDEFAEADLGIYSPRSGANPAAAFVQSQTSHAAEMIDLNAVLADLTNVLPRLLREDITLKTEYASGVPRIEADRGMLEQIVMNMP